mmetsp:Transcript_9675/g.11990  ORF Transcript_9675/g.11990 Transcript_9675/m.11990 type:complete len:210 (+) Transcript_9675:721-1350(+)
MPSVLFTSTSVLNTGSHLITCRNLCTKILFHTSVSFSTVVTSSIASANNSRLCLLNILSKIWPIGNDALGSKITASKFLFPPTALLICPYKLSSQIVIRSIIPSSYSLAPTISGHVHNATTSCVFLFFFATSIPLHACVSGPQITATIISLARDIFKLSSSIISTTLSSDAASPADMPMSSQNWFTRGPRLFSSLFHVLTPNIPPATMR